MIKIGIDYYSEQWDRALWEEDTVRMRALGAHVIRIGEFAWSRMEPKDGGFDFAWLDDAIETISRQGMQVILGTPTNCAPGQELPTVFRNLCGCHVTEYDPIGPVKQTVNLTKGGTYQITSWCDLLELDTAQAWARYQERFYSGVPAIAKNCFGEGVAYYVGTVGEKAMYRTLLMEAFREQNIPLLETLPQGVESTTRSGDGGTYQFFFNNTLHGQNFQLQGERVHLRPLEMKIRTEKAVWV